MTPQALTALQKSIQHWQDIVDGKEFNTGWMHCALCVEFIHKSDECMGCPVRERTGERYCKNTPYHAVVRAKNLFQVDTARELAVSELEFLKSLLPGSTMQITPVRFTAVVCSNGGVSVEFNDSNYTTYTAAFAGWADFVPWMQAYLTEGKIDVRAKS